MTNEFRHILRGARHSDRGASALTIALAMVIMMGMAAIAIDAGLGFNERRLDQNGVDASIMAGAVEFALAGDQQDAVDQILNFVNTNIRATGLTAWEAPNCTDSGALTLTANDLGLNPATDCISFDTFSRIRVRVPDQTIDSAFGGVLGVDSLTTSAFAEALVIQFPGVGSPPPFAVLSGHGGGDVVCLRTSAAGNPPPLMLGNEPGNPPTRGPLPAEADPCDDTVYDVDSETFGLLDPHAYFDASGNIACKQNANDYFIATGIDHPVGAYYLKYDDGWDPGDPEVQDGDGCGGSPKNPVSGPDTMPIKTGLTAQELRCGMITTRAGSCSSTVPGPAATGLSAPARLQSGDPAFIQSHRFLGEQMDNAALWQFFTVDGANNVSFSDAPSSCDDFATAINNNFPGDWDYYDKRDDLLDCLQSWNGDSPDFHDPIFRADIWSSSRFAFIPFLAESTLDGSVAPPAGPSSCPASGGSCVHIDDFVPVWLQTLYTQSPNGACDDTDAGWGMHHAGQQNSCGQNNGNLVRLSSIVLDCGMLPTDVCEARPGQSPGGNITPRLELTR